MGNPDWGRTIRNMHDAHDSNADEEAKALWREFVRKFRNGDFDVLVGPRQERFVSWDALDRFIRR